MDRLTQTDPSFANWTAEDFQAAMLKELIRLNMTLRGVSSVYTHGMSATADQLQAFSDELAREQVFTVPKSERGTMAAAVAGVKSANDKRVTGNE